MPANNFSKKNYSTSAEAWTAYRKYRYRKAGAAAGDVKLPPRDKFNQIWGWSGRRGK
jgi:hypothetical protein